MVKTVVSLLLLAGCASTPPDDGKVKDAAERDCAAWKIEVVVDGRLVCVDEHILEHEQEIIELDDDW